MKNLTTSLMSVILFVSCVNTTEEYTIQNINKYPVEDVKFNGKVEESTSASYYMDNSGVCDENKCEEVRVMYAPNGTLLLYAEYNDSNEFGEYSLYKSDEYTLSGKRNEISLCKSAHYCNGTYSLVYKYDNNLVVGEFDSEDQTPRCIYKYNASNQLVEEEIYDVLYSTDKPSENKVYSYDTENRITSITVKNTVGDVDKEKYTYDDNSNITIIDYCGTNPFYSKVVKKYNEMNDVVLETRYNKRGRVDFSKSYTYEYDSFNNWITRVSKTNDGTNIKSVRDIKYYN